MNVYLVYLYLFFFSLPSLATLKCFSNVAFKLEPEARLETARHHSSQARSFIELFKVLKQKTLSTSPRGTATHAREPLIPYEMILKANS